MTKVVAGLVAAMLLGVALAAGIGGRFDPPLAVAHGQAFGTATPSLPVPDRTPLPGAPTAQITPTPQHDRVRVWWPDELYPQQDSDTLDILQSQFDGFVDTYAAYDLEVRRKRTAGLGGILPTLRTARPVAPGALPDLTLMRRADMITAANDGLIEPLDDWLPASLSGTNLLPGVRALGEIDGVLYGVPYLIEILHVAYRPAALPAPPVSFRAVLDAGEPLLFAAGESPVSTMALLQYLQMGGRLSDDDGAAVLDRDPLVAVLTYYAEGRAAGVFDVNLLQFTQTADYWNEFVTANNNLAVVDTLTYLQHRDNVPGAEAAPLPTADGEPITVLDGWMWVVTSPNPDHRQRTRALLAWLMRVSQQGAFSEAFGLLPSQTRALRLWDDEAYADFAQDLVRSGIVIADAQRNSSAALALQEALMAVFEGASPETAADAVLARFTS